MAAEVCLLLMQSLTSDCSAELPPMEGSIPHVEETTPTAASDIVTTKAEETIAPTAAKTEPQFGQLCDGEQAQRLVACVLPSSAQSTGTAPSSMSPPTTARAPSSAATATPSASTTPSPSPERTTATAIAPETLTSPVALDIPLPQLSIPLPADQGPQFSTPRDIAALAPPSTQPNLVRQRPASGAQLYRQRQLALRAGQSYTRLSPNTYADQWSRATHQPTYQEWQALMAQEARAIAGGQGNNRLEVVVGDSFGLWLPPELLPRDRLWLNQSISGDTTAGILQRVRLFANTRPTTIHLMAGANDLKNGVPEAQIISNLQRTVRTLQQQHPQAQIVVYSVLPTRWPQIANDRVRSLNNQIAALTQQQAVDYRDVHAWFEDEWGELRQDLTTDGLHLNPQGYALWQRAILARAQ
jgi:lysophospholipase L1-like esterase